MLSFEKPDARILVFLDLESAIELAALYAILSFLMGRGVRRKLVNSIPDYLTDRQIRVRFQGRFPHYRTLDNRTPLEEVKSDIVPHPDGGSH